MDGVSDSIGSSESFYDQETLRPRSNGAIFLGREKRWAPGNLEPHSEIIAAVACLLPVSLPTR